MCPVRSSSVFFSHTDGSCPSRRGGELGSYSPFQRHFCLVRSSYRSQWQAILAASVQSGRLDENCRAGVHRRRAAIEPANNCAVKPRALALTQSSHRRGGLPPHQISNVFARNKSKRIQNYAPAISKRWKE